METGMFMMMLAALCFAEEPKELLEAAIAKQQVENSIQTIEMTLVAKNGGKRVRRFTLHIRKEGDAVHSYTRFLSPADVAGTQLVVVDSPGKEDPHLLYLPALKRVQRISGKAQSKSFMGSDFSYADLEVKLNGEEEHTLLEDNEQWWIIQTIPTSGSYGKWISHISKSDSIPRKVEYFDRKGEPLKTLSIEQIREEEGISIPTHSEMRHHQKGTATILRIEEIRLNVPKEELPLRMFTATHMEQSE
jgi:hypothetical protein